jgi:raffinose/stachyose/melibiose transport system permease protein
MIIYIAGIQSVSSDLLEAAKIDGATPWQTLKSIIIPLVMPAITICSFLTLSNSFKLFDQNLALTKGNPAAIVNGVMTYQTQMVALNIFDTFYIRYGNQGVGQAKAVMFFLIVGAIALFQLNITRKKEVEV